MNDVTTYFIHRHSWVRWVVVDALEITVCLVVYLLTKVLVRLGPHLRKVSWKKRRKDIFNQNCNLLKCCDPTLVSIMNSLVKIIVQSSHQQSKSILTDQVRLDCFLMLL